MQSRKGFYTPVPANQSVAGGLGKTSPPANLRGISSPGIYTAANRNASGSSRTTSEGSSVSHLKSANLGLSRSSDTRVPPSAGQFTQYSSKRSYNIQAWDAKLLTTQPEDDDEIHSPRPFAKGRIFSSRGLANVGCISVLLVCILGLFIGYPVAQHLTSAELNTLGINGTGQVPQLIGNWGVIDNDTPQDARTFSSFVDGSEWQLVFSDEFNTDGRTFYPGDDPYWEAVNLQYWETGNLNWYDPAAIITKDGALEITLSKQPSHGLDYRGGMLATWNKFCFTGGMVLASVTLPGQNNVSGLWPAIWTLGNLGRVGYGATMEGMWPYSYDTCDVGAVANQTLNGQPAISLQQGVYNNDSISNLPGQKLSRCTCNGEEHPGPKHSDGTYVGRSVPEIDLFEAQVDGTTGCVSQSAQWAPFDNTYEFRNDSSGLSINDPSITFQNTYTGGPSQQATSYVSDTNQVCYQLNDNCFSTYGMEYKPGYEADNAYISWVSDNKQSWTLKAAGVGADSATEISARPISQEPMYLIANLGMSSSFSFLDLDDLVFPAVMRVDWIRVYQPKNSMNIGCDPASAPTMDYINNNMEAYSNPNLTTWRPGSAGYGKAFPKNSLSDGC